ncbi:mannosyl oligosaccharide glucosidase-domain-containing protein [Kalaharituber pfeilii]|nr:mannosyl oligosaccharide glucosidase-domain-containing protein [Kalaharituber pfeilii]
MADPEELWSPYSLCLLSKSDLYFSTEGNHWCGPLWININYIALCNLLEYARVPGPGQKQVRQMYLDLRKNVVQGVEADWCGSITARAYARARGRSTSWGGRAWGRRWMSLPGKVSLVQKEYVDWAA